MRLLLDTHIALWLIADDPRLKTAARAMIEQAEMVFVSTASLWEIAIKFAKPRGQPDDMPLSATEAREEFEKAGLEFLDVTAGHAAAVDGLVPHHGDPFDRMLVAQAVSEPLHLLTADRQLGDYGEMVKLI